MMTVLRHGPGSIWSMVRHAMSRSSRVACSTDAAHAAILHELSECLSGVGVDRAAYQAKATRAVRQGRGGTPPRFRIYLEVDAGTTIPVDVMMSLEAWVRRRLTRHGVEVADLFWRLKISQAGSLVSAAAIEPVVISGRA